MKVNSRLGEMYLREGLVGYKHYKEDKGRWESFKCTGERVRNREREGGKTYTTASGFEKVVYINGVMLPSTAIDSLTAALCQA